MSLEMISESDCLAGVFSFSFPVKVEYSGFHREFAKMSPE